MTTKHLPPNAIFVMKMFKRIKIAIAIAISFEEWERERESREKREARPEPAVARAKDFYALLSHFRVYIVNWLTSNDEGEGAEKAGLTETDLSWGLSHT